MIRHFSFWNEFRAIQEPVKAIQSSTSFLPWQNLSLLLISDFRKKHSKKGCECRYLCLNIEDGLVRCETSYLLFLFAENEFQRGGIKKILIFDLSLSGIRIRKRQLVWARKLMKLPRGNRLDVVNVTPFDASNYLSYRPLSAFRN